MSESLPNRTTTSSTTPDCPPWWLSGVVFLVLVGIGLWLAPPLYNFDGYMYRLEGRSPIDNLNPTHLLWVPIQAAIWQACDWFHWGSPVPFQVVGILFAALAHAIFFRLLARRMVLVPLALATTVFVATSPWIWQLTPINQPYPLLFLVVVLILFVWRTVPHRPATLVWLGALVLLAVLLQEAAVLWCGTLVGLLSRPTTGPMWQRLRRAAVWGIGVGIAILGAFLTAAALLELHSCRDIYEWLIGYTQTQHGLLQRPIENVVKGGMGFLQTLIQCDRLVAWLQQRYLPAQILNWTAIVEGTALGLGLFLLGNRRLRQAVQAWPWRAPLFLAGLSLTVTWAVFCVIWEPTGYYWSVALFPLFAALVLILENSPARYRWLVIGALLAGTAWNFHEDHRVDRQNGARFPDPQLARIRQVVRPQDELVFLQHEWIAQVDYDLLANCLECEGWTNITTLVEKYFATRLPNWEVSAAAKINATLKNGGRIYISDLVFRPAMYDDLAGEGAFSTYIVEANKSIQGPALAAQVQQFFRRYQCEPSDLQLGTDHFWVITGRSN